VSRDEVTLAQLHIERGDARRTRRAGLLGWSAAFLLLVGCVWWSSAPRALSVRTVSVQRQLNGPLEPVLTASGHVVARRRATVSAPTTGRLLEVSVEAGTEVERGQVLARIDDRKERAHLALAQAEERAQGAALEEARIAREHARRKMAREDKLWRAGFTSLAAFEDARAAVDLRQAQWVRRLEEQRVAARRRELWQREAAEREIRAPFSGVVISKDAQPGEMVSPVSAGGGFTRTGIATLVDMNSLEFEVEINERYLRRVAPGQRVDVVADADPERPLAGRVVEALPTADRERGTVKVRVQLERSDTPDLRLLPEMAIDAVFRSSDEGSARPAALTIPRAAIREASGGAWAFAVRDGRVQRRALRLGALAGEHRVVLAGLAAGERVVVDAPASLRPGDPVREVGP